MDGKKMSLNTRGSYPTLKTWHIYDWHVRIGSSRNCLGSKRRETAKHLWMTGKDGTTLHVYR